MKSIWSYSIIYSAFEYVCWLKITIIFCDLRWNLITFVILLEDRAKKEYHRNEDWIKQCQVEFWSISDSINSILRAESSSPAISSLKSLISIFKSANQIKASLGLHAPTCSAVERALRKLYWRTVSSKAKVHRLSNSEIQSWLCTTIFGRESSQQS